MGTASQGKTIEDAIVNLQETTELYLEEFPQELIDKFGLPADVFEKK